VKVALREPERDDRFDFSGGHIIPKPAQIQRPEKFVLMSGRNEKYSGFGLPTLNFSQTNVIVAEFLTIKLTPQITCELKRGQVFKEATDQSVTFVFCGLARPKGNDMYLYFLADKEKASETSFSRFFTVAFRISEE
jgi:hypothetical protein